MKRMHMIHKATGGFPSQRACNAGFGVLFYVSLNKRLNKQSSRRWLETVVIWSVTVMQDTHNEPLLQARCGCLLKEAKKEFQDVIA